ncbi:hypothetical protein KM043_008506 [Ampulex compressa]|nr:hypothetical protein KM043_008506 [Ampulex compressa]
MFGLKKKLSSNKDHKTPKNSPAKLGFQNVDLVSPTSNPMGVSRRSSISSITSDTSSLFPIYESPANLYHLQSDMDQSASEVDDNISSQLDKVSKEQLYSAYRKVQAKYHKYRGRYTDLTAHYRELERVKTKLESVLVETQDKVLRRVADLKEQCQLGQQAKAHLEEALRNDIEEKDHIINTLNTKIELLQANEPSLEKAALESAEQSQNTKVNLIDLSSDSGSAPNENVLLNENVQLKEKLKKLESLVLKYKDSLKRNKEKFTEMMEEKNKLEHEYETYKKSNVEELRIQEEKLKMAYTEITSLTDQVNVLKKREEESVISLAENKLSVHRELEDKEEQIKQLQLELKHMSECKENLENTTLKQKADLEKLKLLHGAQNTDVMKDVVEEDGINEKLVSMKDIEGEPHEKAISAEKDLFVKHSDKVDSNVEESNLSEKLKGATNVIESMQVQLKQKETELHSLQEKLEELQRISHEQQRNKEELHVQLSECKLKNKELKDERDAQSIVIGEKKRESESTIEKLQATIQSLDKELENMRNALTDRDRVCENFRKKIQESDVALEKAKQQLMTNDIEIKKLQERLEDHTELNKLQDELENKNIELLGLCNELESCKSTILDLRNKLQADNAQIDVLAKEKNCLLANITEYKKSLGNLKRDCLDIKSDIKGQLLNKNAMISNLSDSLHTLLMNLKTQEIKDTNIDTEIIDDSTKSTSIERLIDRNNKLEPGLGNLKTDLEIVLNMFKGELEEILDSDAGKSAIDLILSKVRAKINNFKCRVSTLGNLNLEVIDVENKNGNVGENVETNESISIAHGTFLDVLFDLWEGINTVRDAIEDFEDLRNKYTEAINTLTTESKKDVCDPNESETKLVTPELNSLNQTAPKKSGEESKHGQALVFENKYYDTELEINYKELLDKKSKEMAALLHSNATLKMEIRKKVSMQIKLLAEKTKLETELKQANQELDEIKATNTGLTTSLQAAQQKLVDHNSVEREMEVLKDENSSVLSKLNQLTLVKEKLSLENKALKDKKNELLKHNQELNESRKILQEKVENHEKNIQHLSKETEKLHLLIETYKCQLNDQEVLIQKLENEAVVMKNCLESRDSTLSVRTENLKQCKEEMEKAKQEFSIEINEVISELNVSQERCKELQFVEDENVKFKSELNDLNQKLINLEKVQLTNNNLITEQITLNKKIEKLEGVELENNKLASLLESSVSTMARLESENTALKSEVDTLKVTKDSQNTRLSHMEIELNEFKLMVDEKTAELQMLNTINEKLLTEVETLKSLSLTVEEREKEINRLSSVINDLEKKLENLQKRTASSMDTTIGTQTEIQHDSPGRGLDESSVIRLQDEKKTLEAQLDEALITFQAKESQLQVLNNELKHHAEQLKKKLQTNEEEQSMRLKQLVKEFQAQLQDKEEELQAALEKRFDRQQNYESKLIQQYKEQLKDFQVELTAKSEQIEGLILENKDISTQREKYVSNLQESIESIKKEHDEEIRDIEKKWKAIVQQRTDKLEAKHEEEINELTKEWRNERRPTSVTENETSQELESTSRVAMAAVQSNTGSFHTLQQTLTDQRRELAELRKLVKLRHDTAEDSMEIEYLRNILFEYMMGRETMVLAKVIAAVVKFDQEQTSQILKKEEDKTTLLGSIRLT